LFSDKLKEVRKLHNVTQAQLASVIGMSRQAVIKYESGERFPDEVTLVKIADFFNISLDYLLDRKGSHLEYVANVIAVELDKTGLLDINQGNEKIESILNVTKALIIEFAKY
jgi:transcriptional regulator with XRE-family HTH domain